MLAVEDENKVETALRSGVRGDLVHNPLLKTVNLYDSDPGWGNPRPSLMNVAIEVLEKLISKGIVIRAREASDYVRYGPGDLLLPF
jgi:hypothetical protein